MDKQENEFLQRLRATFRIEAEEHLRAMSSHLLELERRPTATRHEELLEAAFRHAHSLKGAARAVNLTDVEAVCQSLEGFLAAWKRREVDPAPEHYDVLYRTIDLIAEGTADASGGAARPAFTALIRQIDDLKSKRQPAPSLPPPSPLPPPPKVSPPEARPAEAPPVEALPVEAPTAEKGATAQTVRIAAEKLDQLLLAAEEMLVLKQGAARRAAELRDLQAAFDRWSAEWARVQSPAGGLRNAAGDGAPLEQAGRAALGQVLTFLEWSQSAFKSLEDRLDAMGRAAAKDEAAIGRRVDELLAEAKQLVMLPVATVLDLFPRVVRDLSRAQGKDVALVVRGGEVEMDKRILEQMKDVLIHLVRNGVDHGVERPEERRRQGKPPRATVTIAVAQVEDNKVEIVVSDDGAGIDVEAVKAAAVRLGSVSAAEAARLDDRQALALIFRSQVTTRPAVTEISGRGLGLAIVRETVDALGGRVVVASQRGAGTTFQIRLPALLATFRGILVRAAGQRFVAPTAHVERAVRVRSDEVRTVENRETVVLDGQAVALARLEAVLGMARARDEAPAYLSLVVISAAGARIAFAVDEVQHEIEGLVKPLTRPLSRVRNIAGATVLATGNVVPILNVFDLVKSARHAGHAPAVHEPATAAVTAPVVRKRILVVEDSITSRMLLKNILEAAGYDVATAVDGVEALTELRLNDFDLVVSDVEMPRMDGLDLTAAIRSDRRLAGMPVVLVTALASREDRERGVDVGANAYIVKSSFDQTSLLEAVRRLV